MESPSLGGCTEEPFHPLKESNGRVKEGNTSYNEEYFELVLFLVFFSCPKQNVGPSAVLKIGDKTINKYYLLLR